MVSYASFNRKTATRASQRTMCLALRSFVRTVVNEVNGSVARLLAVCEQKERDKASKLRTQMFEITANKASKKQEIINRVVDKHRKRTAYVYKMQHEQC